MDVMKAMISLILLGLDKLFLQKIYYLFVLLQLASDQLVNALNMTTIYVVFKRVVCNEIDNGWEIVII